ncbi:hypothetical protein E4U59_004632 [Claviceps monticola]|nr:hypothetical protein E4U59_004632 [Claviceps monticola]
MAPRNMSDSPPSKLDFDVIIIGAGVSGINAAYRIQQRLPDKTYTILESRDTIGGTWDLWRYPGIRSDSDVFTFSFAWNPWPEPTTLVSGEKFRKYLTQSVELAGIDGHIQFKRQVISANWVSLERYWEVTVRDKNVGDAHQQGQEALQAFRSRFIFLGTGYYDYEEPLQTLIPGLDQFEGKLIRPQFWPAEYDFADKEMVIIGSGATATCILPAVAKQVKHVTLVQRSPTWYVFATQHSKLASFLAAIFPTRIAYRINRYRWLAQAHFLVCLSKYAPRIASAILRRRTLKELPEGVSWEEHFQPRYNPWEQRLCAVLDGDFFQALRSGKASVVTDSIETVTKDGVKMRSGHQVSADVIVAATGFKLKFGGNIRFSLNNVEMDATKKFAWKASMLQDVPNLVFSFGYQNAAWTLGADCAAEILIRLMRQLEKQGVSMATPRLDPKDAQMEPKPMFSLKATYLKHMVELFPRGGLGQWRPRSNYMADFWSSKWGDMKTDLVVE